MQRQSRGFSASTAGLSPRVRGHHVPIPGKEPPERTIPAGAGTPYQTENSSRQRRDYPRGCGDTSSGMKGMSTSLGLSPRVRGHPSAPSAGRRLSRTIPAGAGTPAVRSRSAPARRDYPRGCGDTQPPGDAKRTDRGLSPRVRGHLSGRPNRSVQVGTIPAGAGTPSRARFARRAIRDYPRGCGDTRYCVSLQTIATGLSPRVRGHLLRIASPLSPMRTIPAGAGTPAANRIPVVPDEDYPRGCGDTVVGFLAAILEQGLSPRVRGHRPLERRAGRPGRTIPAGAGTPDTLGVDRFAGQDYPRGCGDTLPTQAKPRPNPGLSPRVRGHHHTQQNSLFPDGTIPAGAGTPYTYQSAAPSIKDYPRGCGDTESLALPSEDTWGLSPRVRGHLRCPTH